MGQGWTLHRGGAKDVRELTAPPYARSVVVWRASDTGRFMKAPAPAAEASIILTLPVHTDTVIFRHTIDYGDGMPEVVSVTVKSSSSRAALLAGELTKAALQNFEADMALDILRQLNPQAAQEYELAQMREAHNSDKGKRAAHTRKKNAEVLAATEKRRAEMPMAQIARVRKPKRKG